MGLPADYASAVFTNTCCVIRWLVLPLLLLTQLPPLLALSPAMSGLRGRPTSSPLFISASYLAASSLYVVRWKPSGLSGIQVRFHTIGII